MKPKILLVRNSEGGYPSDWVVLKSCGRRYWLGGSVFAVIFTDLNQLRRAKYFVKNNMLSGDVDWEFETLNVGEVDF